MIALLFDGRLADIFCPAFNRVKARFVTRGRAELRL